MLGMMKVLIDGKSRGRYFHGALIQYMTGEGMILEPEKLLSTTGRNHPTKG